MTRNRRLPRLLRIHDDGLSRHWTEKETQFLYLTDMLDHLDAISQPRVGVQECAI